MARVVDVRTALALLVMVFSTAAPAQPLTLDQGGLPSLAGRDTQCEVPKDERVVPATFIEAPKDALGDWTNGQPIDRLLPAPDEDLA